MIRLKSKEQLYHFLNSMDWESKKITSLSSVYFLIGYSGYAQVIYFAKYEDCWFESPCFLRGFPLNDIDFKQYIQDIYLKEAWDEAYEYESIFQKNNYHFEIDSPQVSPFLPEDIEIIKIMSEKECLEYLLEASYNIPNYENKGIIKNNKICNECRYLSINEYEQNYIKSQDGGIYPHICTKYKKQVKHFPYKEPYIHPCEECEM